MKIFIPVIAITINLSLAQTREACLTKSKEYGTITGLKTDHSNYLEDSDFLEDMRLYKIIGCQDRAGALVNLKF